MQKKRVLALLLVLLLIVSIVPIKVNADENKTKNVILIDPGHGGIDGGAQSKSGTIEKDINLEIAIKLKENLENNGYEVYMTRDSDIQLDKKKASDLNARCRMKKDSKCDIFISIHQNMFPQSNCFGAQVWYSANEKSSLLAENIQSSLKETIQDNNKRIAKAAKDEYRILRDKYEGACVLVECGFLSNYDEEQRLKNDMHQNKIVEAITKGIQQYFKDTNK